MAEERTLPIPAEHRELTVKVGGQALSKEHQVHAVTVSKTVNRVASARLHYLPVVTREPGVTALSQRIPALLADGSLATATGLSIDPEHSRVMVCGNPEMSRELRARLSERGFRTTRRGVLGQMAFEKYW